MERATVTQQYQIGVESTPGTAVPANKVLPTVTFDYKPKAEVDLIRPNGWKFPSATFLNKEWAEGKVEGKPCYNALAYLLAGVLKKVAAQQPDATGAPSVYQWTMQPELSAEDTVATFTVERGSSVRADRMSYGIIPEFSLSLDRSKAELGGSVIGGAFEDGITLTADPSEVPVAPLLPGHVDVFLDESFANLGNTKLTRLLSAEFAISNRFGPLWVLDTDQTSWAAKVEKAPTVTMKLKMEADAVGMSPLAKLRAGDTVFLRLQATGPEIEGGLHYGLQIDMPAKVSEEPSDFSDQDGVYAIEWTFHAVYCGDCGFALKAVLTNIIGSL